MTNEVKGVCHYLIMIMSVLNQTPMIETPSLRTVLLRQAHLLVLSLYTSKSQRADNSGCECSGNHMKDRQSILWAEERPTCFSCQTYKVPKVSFCFRNKVVWLVCLSIWSVRPLKEGLNFPKKNLQHFGLVLVTQLVFINIPDAFLSQVTLHFPLLHNLRLHISPCVVLQTQLPIEGLGRGCGLLYNAQQLNIHIVLHTVNQ